MTTTSQALSARQFLKQQNVGVLSTHSVDVAGYPFGSITPYTLNQNGEPLILISNIAQHTRNIMANNKVSLTVFDLQADDVQASARLTWLGDALRAEDEASQRRYLAYFPNASSYFEMHDFALYCIHLQRARFIGGFGQIFWLERAEMVMANPLAEIEAGIMQHMNEDHHDALLKYCEKLKNVIPNEVSMVGIDSEGFDLLADKRKLRFHFESAVTTAEEVRAVLVKMVRTL